MTNTIDISFDLEELILINNALDGVIRNKISDFVDNRKDEKIIVMLEELKPPMKLNTKIFEKRELLVDEGRKDISNSIVWTIGTTGIDDTLKKCADELKKSLLEDDKND